jgi:hypothetical protein
MWCAGWTIPLAALGLTLSIPFWQAVIADTELTVMQQIDYEDETLCHKFGFATGSATFTGCMADLLDLRHDHERLMADTSMP